MKEKALKVLLILAVIGIWVAIISRVWSSASKDDNTHFTIRKSTDASSSVKDLFRYAHLKAKPIKRDPFSGEEYEEIKADSVVRMASKPSVEKFLQAKPVQKDWSEGVLLTGIGNQSGGKKLAMLSIHGKAVILQIGETAEGIKVTKILNDAVELKSGQIKKTIEIQKR